MRLSPSRRPPLAQPLLLLPLLVLSSAVLAPPASGDAGETRKFAEHGFELTVPSSEWTYQDVSAEMRQAGYVLQLTRQASPAFVRVDVRVAPSNGLSLAELANETTEALRHQLASVSGTRQEKGKLSGLDAAVSVVTGAAGNGVPGAFRAYSIEQGGKFHQMIFFLVHGAGKRLADELDALKRGYRLLSGAGPQEPAAPGEWSGTTGDAGASPAAGGGGDTERPSNWPEKGPGLEGHTVSFPSHNLKWTLPEDTPFTWKSVIPDETQKEGLLLAVGASFPREGAKESEPQENEGQVALFVRPSQPGFTPAMAVENQGLQESIMKNVFERAMLQRTKIVKDLAIGNVRGAALQMVGTKEGKVVFFRFYAVVLGDEQYQWECTMSGGEDADNVFKKPVADLMEGIEFLDTTTLIRGPIGIAGIPHHNRARGFGHGEEQKVTAVGFTIEKPEELYQINYQPQQVDPNLRMAWETRTEDGQSYFYVDVQTVAVEQLMRTNPPQKEEDLVKLRETQWKEAAADAVTITKGREPYFDARFSRGRGIGYEFRGALEGAPFVERGYLVRYKKYMYWVRFQFGGENAEDTFSKLAKTIEKAMKFSS